VPYREESGVKSPVRLNRTVLALLGLILLAAGGLGLARGYDAFGSRAPKDQPVLSDAMRRWVSHHHGAFWGGAAAVAVLIALLALVWLRAQLRAPRPADRDLVRSGADGRTKVRSGDAATAVSEEIESWDGVEDASARLFGDPDRPDLLLRVGIAADADLADLRRRIDTDAVAHLRETLELNAVEANVEFRLRSRQGRLVH